MMDFFMVDEINVKICLISSAVNEKIRFLSQSNIVLPRFCRASYFSVNGRFLIKKNKNRDLELPQTFFGPIL